MKRVTIRSIVEEAKSNYEAETGTEITTGTADYLFDIIENLAYEYRGIDEFGYTEKRDIYEDALSEIRSAEQRNRRYM